jgi:CubicO group peptidase (beta-lactamase class C family)
MKKKITLSLVAIVVAFLVIFPALPQNHYIIRALRHQTPKIEQFHIFANRVIEAGDPQPWELHPAYNAFSLNPEQMNTLEKFKSVAFLIAVDSQLLHEAYWEGYGADSRSNSFSMAKSFISMLIGCALDEGYIRSLDQPVADFIPEFGEGEKARITVRHLLAMSSGLSWDEAYSSLFSLTTRAYYGKHLRQLALNQSVVSEPGEAFNYLSGDTQLLSLIIARATGKSLSEYMSEKIWSRIGAEHSALWSLDKEEGIEKAYCCFNSNVRDFARLGRLILNHGNWNGEQLISEEYLNETLKPSLHLPDTELGGIPTKRYGNQWWFTTHRNHEVIYARGILGQYIFIIPDLNMVVVRLGHLRSDERIEGHPVDVFDYLEIAMDMVEKARGHNS